VPRAVNSGSGYFQHPSRRGAGQTNGWLLDLFNDYDFGNTTDLTYCDGVCPASAANSFSFSRSNGVSIKRKVTLRRWPESVIIREPHCGHSEFLFSLLILKYILCNFR
jgi:hypothetical protein